MGSMADDDIDKLLREVEAALGPTSGSKPRAVEPARAADPEPTTGVTDRLRAGVPRATVVGAGCAVVVGGLFSILPFVDGLSGALAAFGTGFVVSVSGRLRRRR
jgi:hypothetical protein